MLYDRNTGGFMTFRQICVLLALLLGVSGFYQPASATVFCEVLPTPDGFVALRAAPNAKAKLLHKLKPGQSVQLGAEKKGSWLSVILYLNQDTPSADDDSQTSGWVNGRYLNDVCG
jgi:hypothetical protein